MMIPEETQRGIWGGVLDYVASLQRENVLLRFALVEAEGRAKDWRAASAYEAGLGERWYMEGVKIKERNAALEKENARLKRATTEGPYMWGLMLVVGIVLGVLIGLGLR